MNRRIVLRGAAALALLVGLPASPARSEQTRVMASTPSDVQHGEAEGMAVTSRGRMFVAPRIGPPGKATPGGPPSHVFASSADESGNVFFGTGPDGQVLKVTRTGDEEVFFRADEPLVTSVLVLASGDLLAATAPGGKIYKVRPDGKGGVWCETGEKYVWALVAGADGVVLAATGERGRLLRIDRNGNAQVWFDGDETHLVSLAVARDGSVVAGGSGRGLVYRIDAEGHALVLYDDELPEAKAILVAPSGDLVVAFDAPPLTEKRAPSLRLRLAGGMVGGGESMTDLDARQAPGLEGVIEGLPSADAEEALPLRGKIVRITAEGAAAELWRSRDEAPFALTLDDRDRAVFATGEPAKLWRVEGPDEIALLATLKEAQATAFARSARTLVAATSNPEATYRIEREPSDAGTFLARPVDAGSVARWGTISWRSLGSGGRVELFTRTGNCEEPDGTWSAWGPARVDAAGSPVTNPDGRFLQWRARIARVADDGPSLSSVSVSYATRNRAPSLRDLRIEPATGAIAAKTTIRWSAADPDGDSVVVDVQARPAGTGAWKSAVRTDPTPSKPSDPSLPNDGSSKDGKATWDTAAWDEGLYEVRAVATDQPSNAPEEALEAEAWLSTTVRVDRTPPSIEAKRSGGAVDVVVTDALSAVARLEIVVDGRVVSSPRCGDGVCDGVREAFRFPAPQAAAGEAFNLRATDAAGNAAESAVPAP